ncbi:SpaA isopeptide-forming pilin-related protein [Kitasatospora sp. NPDC006697]|uniref:SpaA isopeptide-forming pilin-related protein n=1 Tax=Kitasatospora sp. NPDC006697 TaxID=3364020 RepID=UPI0036853A23
MQPSGSAVTWWGRTPRRLAATLAALAVAGGYLTIHSHPARAAAGDGSVTVRVVRAVDNTGVYTPVLEPGLSGVTVNLTDDAGTTISGTTAADGTVTLRPASSGLTGGKYRVQVINPKPGIFYSAFASRQGLSGAPNQLSSTEEFVDLSGGKNVSYTTALWNPDDYCQKNAPLVTACVRGDVNPTEPGTARTLLTFPYNARGVENQTTNIATKAQTGALYGIGYSKQKKWIFSGAHAHRASGYGPSGPGAVYLTDRATNATSLFTTVPNAGTTVHNFAVDMDLGFAPAVAKEALGDVEVSDDGADLYVVNLNDRKLYRYDATNRTASAPKASYDIPGPDSPCPAAGDWRPYGLGIQDGVVYVGGVCSGESTQKKADLRAVVRTFDPAAGTFGSVILDQRLDYPRLRSNRDSVCPGAGWYPWQDKLPTSQDGIASCGPGNIANPEPMLADIVVDTDGALILSFRDRYTDQIGLNQQYMAGSGLLASPASGGALSRACPGANGMFVMYENGGCGNTSGTRGGGFYDQHRSEFHNNALYSGIALSKVETTIASSAIDPTDAIFTGGTAWTNRDGSRATGLGNQLTTTFGKGGSMADLEVLCDLAPLQIGNRVWYDVRKSGLQDPGDPVVVGATVHLYDAGGTRVGTMKTTARGEYYFDDSNVTGGLKPNTAYTIKLDNPADYAAGGPLYQWVPTTAHVGTNPYIDSDGTVPAGAAYPQTSLTTGGPGQNNHTYDFGFVQPEGRVGVVKQDPGGRPLAGATFQLWKDAVGGTGSKVGAPCTTGADGVCSATVPLGTYYWEETQAPPDYALPNPPVFGPLVLTMDNYRQGISTVATDQLHTGAVSVVKQDPKGNPLAGAVFQLWHGSVGGSGSKVGDPCTTGADGVCSATVPIGTYYWEETRAPAGFDLPDPAVFGPLVLTSANYQQGVRVTAVDPVQTGRVSVLKQDPKGNPLAGAVFQLWQGSVGGSGSKVGTPCTTGADGLCSTTVPLGTYFWEETEAPAGFDLPTPAVFGPLVLTSANHLQGVSTTAVDQPQTGKVSVLKQDPKGNPLAGAVFQLWRGSVGDTKVGTPCTTGTDGLCSETVPLGTYFWEETLAPAGFDLPTPAVFGPLVLTSANHLQGVSTTAVDPVQTGRVSVLKEDPKGNPLAGAVFQLWRDAVGGTGSKVGAPCTTGMDGLCSETVPLGTYFWEETQAPAGFDLPDPAVFGPLTLTPDNHLQGLTATAVDQPQTGKVSVLKHDPAGKPLAGAVFQLWKDAVGGTGSKVGAPCTTGADGLCTETVPLGAYFWEETHAPAGFDLPDPAVFGPLVLTSANHLQGVSTTAVDPVQTGRVSVLKEDPKGNPLAGAVFQLWRDAVGGSGSKVGAPCTTGMDGLCSETVPLGTYFWEETQAPAGFELPNPAVFGPLVLTSANHLQGLTATAVDQPQTGRVSVVKHDPAGKPLAGAVFQLWKDAVGGTGSKVGAPCTTGADGLCAETVPLGTYYWEETQAPAGYDLPTPAVFGPLVLTSANHLQGVGTTAVDQPKPGWVHLLKRDRDTHQALAGAVFQLWRQAAGGDEKVGEPCTTGSDGVCAFGPLPTGDYFARELQAPVGHRLPADPVTRLRITASGPEQAPTVIVDNEKVPPVPPLPNTGSPVLLPGILAGALLLVGGALVGIGRTARRRSSRR